MKNKILIIIVLVIIAIGLISFMNMFSSEKKLRYVQATNAGLLGYFDNGSVAACPKCDFIQHNIDSLYEKESVRSWDKNRTPESFEEDQNNSNLKSSWVMVDYKWVIRPELDIK